MLRSLRVLSHKKQLKTLLVFLSGKIGIARAMVLCHLYICTYNMMLYTMSNSVK